MSRTVKEQLREYFEYVESSLVTDLNADRAAVPARRLDEEPPRSRGPGWAVAVGVAVAALAVVALAAAVVSALDRSPAATTIAPAVTTTTAVETTVAEELDRVVRDAGPAEQAGWQWLDHGSVGFPSDPGAETEIIGMIDTGVVLFEGYEPPQSCASCVLHLWARDGSVQSHQLDVFDGQEIEQRGVSVNLIWVLLRTRGISGVVDPDQNMWVSADGVNWDQVEVIDPHGVRTLSKGRALEDLWFVRFLRQSDQILAVNMVNGLMSLSSDEGKTFEVIDHNAEFFGRSTDGFLLIRRTWATQDGFFVVSGRNPQLWHSPDGRVWDLLGDVEGSPNWDEPSVPVATSPEPLVLPLADGRLLTMDFIHDFTPFVSEDGGLSWEPIPGPYPFEDGYEAVVNQGWMHVWDAGGQTVWVSVDGNDWYEFPGRTASSFDPASGVFIDGRRIAIPPSSP